MDTYIYHYHDKNTDTDKSTTFWLSGVTVTDEFKVDDNSFVSAIEFTLNTKYGSGQFVEWINGRMVERDESQLRIVVADEVRKLLISPDDEWEYDVHGFEVIYDALQDQITESGKFA